MNFQFGIQIANVVTLFKVIKIKIYIKLLIHMIHSNE
jgi:hypothetical protein